MSKKQDNNLTQEELNLIKETERFMEGVNADPEVANAELPPELYGKLMDKIYEKKAERDKNAETEELLRLGRACKKRRKARKYWVAAAAAVLALSFGITSIGGGKRILEVLHLDELGRDQSQTNTDGAVDALESISEEEVYQWIEDEYGFYPVVMGYRPKGVGFLEAKVNDNVEDILISYGQGEKTRIVCRIHPNYVEFSGGVDAEERVDEEFEQRVENCIVHIKKYIIEDGAEQRWLLEFIYQNVQYSYRLSGIEKEEVEKIVKNLSFY